VSAPVHANQNQGQVRTHLVILLQHDLIALKLAAHPKYLHLQVVDDLRILVIVLLELLLGEPLALGLLALFLLRLDLLLEPPPLLLGLLLRLESALLVLVLLEHRGLLTDHRCARRRRRRGGGRASVPLPLPPSSATWAARPPARCPAGFGGFAPSSGTLMSAVRYLRFEHSK